MESSSSQNNSIYGDSIKQQGSFGTGVNKGRVDHPKTSVGVGFNDGTIEANEVAGNVYKAQEKTLAEAAAEIQQLLDQLYQTYSPEEAEQKVAEDLANKAKQDPSVKENLKSWSLSLAGKGVETGVVETVKEGVKRVIPLAISLLI